MPISLTIEDETTVIMRTFESLIKYARNYRVSKEHLSEFEKLEAQYHNHIQTLVKPGLFPPLTLELSDDFFSTWMWRAFDELFASHSGISKKQANALNELHRKLFENKDHKEFKHNYNNYRDY